MNYYKEHTAQQIANLEEYLGSKGWRWANITIHMTGSEVGQTVGQTVAMCDGVPDAILKAVLAHLRLELSRA